MQKQDDFQLTLGQTSREEKGGESCPKITSLMLPEFFLCSHDSYAIRNSLDKKIALGLIVRVHVIARETSELVTPSHLAQKQGE